MSAANTTRWIGVGLIGLSLYGALTFFSSLNPQPDPNTHPEAWARHVTTTHYVLEHLFLSVLGLIFAIFGVFALGVYLATSRAGGMGLVAMVITVTGSALLLVVLGVSTFAAPEEGQAVLAGMNLEELPSSFADTALALTGLGYILLGFVGNILLGVAIWRSGTLPKWAGALWAAAHVLIYLGQAYASTIGARSTPPTVLVGALLIVISGAWMAWSVLRGPSAAQEEVGVGAQPRVQ
jgi:multisubunit Na+/H+ antiporter MnhC subunit